uniref:C2H2-type domain-containing protein n=1 Tax=Timema shepardi TaxID=629360 RepID=A0A7R9AZ87_TIMSH|nr:unnamed protein product [Timema shepardi]
MRPVKMSEVNKKRNLWTDGSLEADMKAVQRGQQSQSAASEHYGVPRRTLRNHLKTEKTTKSLGTKSVLTNEQEKNLVERIEKATDLYPVNTDAIPEEAFAPSVLTEIPEPHYQSMRTEENTQDISPIPTTSGLNVRRHPIIYDPKSSDSEPEPYVWVIILENMTPVQITCPCDMPWNQSTNKMELIKNESGLLEPVYTQADPSAGPPPTLTNPSPNTIPAPERPALLQGGFSVTPTLEAWTSSQFLYAQYQQTNEAAALRVAIALKEKALKLPPGRDLYQAKHLVNTLNSLSYTGPTYSKLDFSFASISSALRTFLCLYHHEIVYKACEVDLRMGGTQQNREKPHACDVCDKAFSTKSSLNTHKRIHSGEKPHICQLCGKKFTASSNLYYHRMTHIKEKPHKCPVCPKSFPTPGDLRAHNYIHNGSWPYKCDVCDRGFSKVTNLRNHMFLHSVYKLPLNGTCVICGKTFNQHHEWNFAVQKIVDGGDKGVLVTKNASNLRSSGLTHKIGRVCSKVTNAIGKLCRMHLETSELHVELQNSRQSRDDKDFQKILSWFECHSPFESNMDGLLLCLSAGVIADSKNNNNKSRLIDAVTSPLRLAGVSVHSASDTLIISVALEKVFDGLTMTVVGTDIALLAMIVARVFENEFDSYALCEAKMFLVCQLFCNNVPSYHSIPYFYPIKHLRILIDAIRDLCCGKVVAECWNRRGPQYTGISHVVRACSRVAEAAADGVGIIGGGESDAFIFIAVVTNLESFLQCRDTDATPYIVVNLIRKEEGRENDKYKNIDKELRRKAG